MMISMVMINSLFMAGCWNYREIDKLSIVAGVAVDKGPEGQYVMTAEIIQISGGKDSKTSSKIVTMEGKTVFDAVRDGISVAGKRLYWSHAKVLILSKEIAGEGITKVVDWYIRDAESREDVYILISEAESAKEILEGQETTDSIKAMTLSEIMENQRSLSKAPIIDILQYENENQTKGLSTVIPVVRLKQADGKTVPEIMGTAIIKNDKLVGYLNGEETRDLIFIRDKVEGGVLVEDIPGDSNKTPVSLEIFKNKTKAKPLVSGKNIQINLDIETTVAIDEIGGAENFIDDKGRRRLEQIADDKLKTEIEALIRKVQTEYGTDIFGFGIQLHENKSKTWHDIENNWEEIFRNIKVNVSTQVHIKNSAILSKTLGKED